MASKAEIENTITRTGGYADLVLRPEDAFIVWEVYTQGHYKDAVQPGDVVLDVGGHVGIFGAWALEQGAKRVVSYEPESMNFALLKQNSDRLGKRKWKVHQLAVMGDNQPTTIRGRGMNASVVVTRTQPAVEVPAIPLAEAIRREQPTSVKIDVEGAEYLCLTDEALDELGNVDRLAIEWHHRKDWMIEESVRLDQELRDRGFEARELTVPERITGWGKQLTYAQRPLTPARQGENA